MRLGWLSDIHLDAAPERTRAAFLRELAATRVDAWLLGGDIDIAPYLVRALRDIKSALSDPVYFVLGNHDFYGASIASVRDDVRSAAGSCGNLVWLTGADPVALDGEVALVGDDGWGDGRFGDPHGSTLELTDFYAIRDLVGLSREDRIRALNRLGDECAARLAPKLRAAANMRHHVVVLTHVPPFREATWHEGRISDDHGLPWFSCKAVGDVILEAARDNPTCDFLVLCGHTHSGGRCAPASNIEVITAQAEYEKPRIQAILELNGDWIVRVRR
jgi:predicted phosphodiesterase